MDNSPIIAVDFDGTLVTHAYPKIGRGLGATTYLIDAQCRGAKIILWTMRDGQHLHEARKWCENRGLFFWGINRNPDQDWSMSPKVYAHIYIDDAALGVPLFYPKEGRPYVDWDRCGPQLFGWLEHFKAPIIVSRQDL